MIRFVFDQKYSFVRTLGSREYFVAYFVNRNVENRFTHDIL